MVSTDVNPGRLPKFRGDLVISHQPMAEGGFFVVKDPLTGRFFRFREAEHFIASQFDGATEADVIRCRTEERLGASLSPETLTKFVQKLDRNGLLESREAGCVASAGRSRRVQGDLLHLRVRAFDPNSFFNWLIRRVGFLFTPQFVMIAAVSILFASVVAICNWHLIVREFASLYSFRAFLLAWLMIFAVTVLHEFAHGLTCKFFGGEVRELGFFLLYFQPALYCNVSDAWLFPEKFKRLWVSLAGPYFELFVLALATLVWRVTDFGTWPHFLSLLVVATSLIRTLINFNPLIKLDGYYLLSDYLEISNLRRRSFTYIGAWLKRLTGLTGGHSAEVGPRERRIFLVYGLVASIFSFWLLGYVAFNLGSFLIEHQQRWLFTLLMALLVVVIRQRFRQFFPRTVGSQSALRRLIRFLCKPTTLAEAVSGNARSFKRPLLILVAGAAVVAFLFLVRIELKIGGEFVLLPVRRADVRAEVEGIVEQIYVEEGREIDEGDPVALLFDRQYQAEKRRGEADMDRLQAKLSLLRVGPRPEEIELAKTAVTKSAERLRYGQSRLGRDQALFEQKLLSSQAFEDTQQQEADRQGEFDEAKKRLALLLAGARKEEIDATMAEIAQVEAQLRLVKDQLRSTLVVSPVSGVVTTPSRMLKGMSGQLVKKGDPIAKVEELKTVTAEIEISEKDIADVKVGQPVLLKVRAFPQECFRGTVGSIALAAVNGADFREGAGLPGGLEEGRGRGTILVTTELENGSLLLKPEMTGRVKILCGKRRVLELVTRRFARTLRVEFWSWW